MSRRIPCINPRCRRTADAAKVEPDTEIVCGKCWRNLPRALRDEHRAIGRRERKMQRLVARRLARGSISPDVVNRIVQHFDRRWAANWMAIRSYFLAPPAPAGLETFLHEVGLA